MTLLSKATWAMQKPKIKDVYPKKVDHMLMEYVKKKRKRKEKRCIPKEGMPHACKGMSKKMLIAHS